MIILSIGANPIWDPEESSKDNGIMSKGINPLYREDGKEFENSSSDDDGDDIFIGVEDNDDFKGYKDRYDVSTCEYIDFFIEFASHESDHDLPQKLRS